MTDEVTRVEKPWGYELHWAKTDRYVGKLIRVNARPCAEPSVPRSEGTKRSTCNAGLLLFEIQDGDKLVRREMRAGERVPSGRKRRAA